MSLIRRLSVEVLARRSPQLANQRLFYPATLA
ncbi:hypothetical protein HNQ73_003377 [Chelatococcus composti]|uniref:Uncharacterized protein n=1 Tax=Chelatococcus composti TaxID=1743235 RepID=A0A841KBR3_9HYPH|nr:hypothetical protein [Chelatococcus composti]